MPLSMQQRMLQNILTQDISKISAFPMVPTPLWIVELGDRIKELFHDGTFEKMYLDCEGCVVCE